MLKQIEHNKPKIGEPVWELARLYPAQGYWTEEAYLNLETNWLVEYDNGILEVLDMPSHYHQDIVGFLYILFRLWIRANNIGYVVFAPMPLTVFTGKYREPDLLFSFDSPDTRDSLRLTRADLVLEVVSRDRTRDFVTKREEYAATGIPEYWIVDPKHQEIHVLVLEHTNYVTRGVFGRGQIATSALLQGFEVNVSQLFDEA